MAGEPQKRTEETRKHRKKRRKKQSSLTPVIVVLLVILIAVIAVIAVAIGKKAKDLPPTDPALTKTPAQTLHRESEPDPLSPVSEPADTDIVPPAPVTEPPVTEPPVTEPPETDKPETPVETEKPKPKYVHEYPGALGKSEKVPANWFDDALFVGDSRTVGLASYSGVKATYYGRVSLNIQTAFKTKFLDEDKHTILEAIAANPKYKKVYFWFGLNEIGWPSTESFCSLYKNMIDQTRELLGEDVPVYVMAIVPVSEAYAKKNAKNGISNENVVKFNQAIAKMCQGMDGVEFVNIAAPFVDATGALDTSRSSDGAHLNKASVLELFEYLRVHA